MGNENQFRDLRDLTYSDVELADESWLAYAVCYKSCGWQGWILESISLGGNQLPANTRQVCPNCESNLFRTEVSLRMEPAKDQTRPLLEGRDYEVSDDHDEETNSGSWLISNRTGRTDSFLQTL